MTLRRTPCDDEDALRIARTDAGLRWVGSLPSRCGCLARHRAGTWATRVVAVGIWAETVRSRRCCLHRRSSAKQPLSMNREFAVIDGDYTLVIGPGRRGTCQSSNEAGWCPPRDLFVQWIGRRCVEVGAGNGWRCPMVPRMVERTTAIARRAHRDRRRRRSQSRDRPHRAGSTNGPEWAQ
jgi:hypothetical protein